MRQLMVVTKSQPESRSDGDRRLLIAAIAVLLLSLAAMALARGPLVYDGSFFLFQVLQNGAPFTPDNRFAAVPVHLLTLAVARLTDDTWSIALAFCALYLALAAGTYLAAAWWLSRHLQRLLVWPLLGLLAVSPILVDATTESLLTGALAFPLVLLAARPKSVVRLAAMGLLAAGLFVSHPAAGLVMVLAGVVAAYRWERTGRRSHGDLVVGVVAVCVGIVRLRLLVPGYETRVAAPATLLAALARGLSYPIVLMVLATWLTGAGLLLRSHGHLGARASRWLPALPLAGAACLDLSVAFGHGWPSPLAYRLAIIPALLPLLVMLAVDAGHQGDAPASAVHLRAAALAIIGVGLCVAAQSWHWNREVETVRAYLGTAQGPCQADIPGDGATSHWGSRSLAVLLQGRHPRVVLGTADDCRRLIADHVYSGSSDFPAYYRVDGGWFRLPR